MVSPVNPTRRRAPGGSFICPYTSAALDFVEVLRIDDLGILHFMPQVISLTGSFPDSRKNRKPSMLKGNIVNEFHDDDSLADSCTTKKPYLSAFGIGFQEIHNFNACFQDLGRSFLIL